MHKIQLKPERVEELKEKIKKSKDIFRQAYERFDAKDMRLIWSGGKDSTLTTWICKQFCQENGLPMPRAFTIDEGDVFEEVDEFLHKWSKKWGVELDWGRNEDVLKAANYTLDAEVNVKDLNERNRQEIKRIGMDIEQFPFEAESYIGNHLMKTVVFNIYLAENNVKAVFQGLRWDEQPARKNDAYMEDAEAQDLVPPHTRFRPILHWQERALWDATRYFGIPYCSLYERGYRSLGAKTTSLIAVEGVPAWGQDLDNTVERAGRRQDKEAQMERLRKLGYM
jgi:phosphoadenosine phosphosulfate reductase